MEGGGGTEKRAGNTEGPGGSPEVDREQCVAYALCLASSSLLDAPATPRAGAQGLLFGTYESLEELGTLLFRVLLDASGKGSEGYF